MPKKKKRYESSDSEDSDSDDSSSSSDDSSEDDSDSDVSSSDSSSDDSDSDSDSESEESDDDDFEDYDEDIKKTKQDIKEIIRDKKLMKFEKAIIEDAGINSLARMRDCTEKQLKKAGLEYAERERLLKAFRAHFDERKEKLRATKKGGKSSKKKSSRSKKSKSKGKKGKGSKRRDDDEDPLAKLDTGWSGKKQAWKDYKDHEARVAELVEFYEEIGRKRANGEEHARKLLCSYPGGIGKLAIALDKKYHHIPYGWEHILEEAYRKEEMEGNSDSD